MGAIKRPRTRLAAWVVVASTLLLYAMTDGALRASVFVLGMLAFAVAVLGDTLAATRAERTRDLLELALIALAVVATVVSSSIIPMAAVMVALVVGGIIRNPAAP